MSSGSYDCYLSSLITKFDFELKTWLDVTEAVIGILVVVVT